MWPYMLLMSFLSIFPGGNTAFFPTLNNLKVMFNDAVDYMSNSLNIETCNSYFIPNDFLGFELVLKQKLFGQHLVIEKLPNLLRNNYRITPKKPLVICMHGWTGCGKNYVSNMLIDSMFRLGSKSKFVHFFNGGLHFPLTDKKHIDEYKVNLQNWIRGNVTMCPQSVFIFDEVDKMSSEIVDAIKPFFDYHNEIDNVDYKKSIFIFLSNIGGNLITQTYKKLWLDGFPREQMEYKHFESVLRKNLYHSSGAFEKSSVLEDHLISMYLPFLPLEKKHVELCIQEEMRRQRVIPQQDKIDIVFNEMEFFEDRFSISGCKRVNDRVAMLKYRDFTEF